MGFNASARVSKLYVQLQVTLCCGRGILFLHPLTAPIFLGLAYHQSPMPWEVNVEESTWTFSDGHLVLELIKKAPDWWLSAVQGGRLGPDPNKTPAPAQMQKLDAKIGEQVVNKKDYEGKSKFQW